MLVQKLATPPRTRTMTLDPKTHRVYVCRRRLQAGAGRRKGRPPIVPGSFRVVVYERREADEAWDCAGTAAAVAVPHGAMAVGRRRPQSARRRVHRVAGAPGRGRRLTAVAAPTSRPGRAVGLAGPGRHRSGRRPRLDGRPLTFPAALELAAARNLGRGRAAASGHPRGAGPDRGAVAEPRGRFEAPRTRRTRTSLRLPGRNGGQRGADRRREGEAGAGGPRRAHGDARAASQPAAGVLRPARPPSGRPRWRGDADVVERTRQAAQARFEEGAAPRLEVLAADLGLARAQAEADLASSARAAALADLNAVLEPAARGPVESPDLGPTGRLPVARACSATASRQRRPAVGRTRGGHRGAAPGALQGGTRPDARSSIGLPMNAPGEFTGGQSGAEDRHPAVHPEPGRDRGSRATIKPAAPGRTPPASVEARVFAALARIEAQRQQVDSYRRRSLPAAEAIAALAEESYKMGRRRCWR